MISSEIRSIPERWWLISVLCVVLSGVTGVVSQAQTEVPDNEAIIQEELRDPFWPVGFYPEGWKVDESELPVLEEKEQVNAWDEAQQLLEVRGVSKMGSSGFYAVINGSTVARGMWSRLSMKIRYIAGVLRKSRTKVYSWNGLINAFIYGLG